MTVVDEPRRPLLEYRRVDAFYGAVQVHFDVTFRIYEGEIVCLLGGNASGKSTAMKVILGLMMPRAGQVIFKGEDVTRLSTAQRIRRGMGSVPEARRIFGQMSVRENLLMGAYLRSDKSQVVQDYEHMLELFPRLKERLRQRAGVLSGGEQQMLAFGRALMGRPQLICMDEPTMGLSPAFVDQVLEYIQKINQMNTTVFMVEQNANLALQIAHRGYVLQNGHVVLEGTGEMLLASTAVQEAYLGL